MKNKIKKTNKTSNQSGLKKLGLVIKKLNKKIPTKAIGRKISIDELALMIGKGFRGVDERFDRVGNDLFLIKERLNRMELKIDSLERRIFAIEDLLTEHRNILNEHSKDIKEIKEELKIFKKTGDNNSEKIIEMDKRIRVLESKVAL